MCAEQWMRDWWHQITPPACAVAEKVSPTGRERRRVRDDGAGRIPHVDRPSRGDEQERPGRDTQAPRGSRVSPACEEPVRCHGDRSHDGRDQAAVEVRERHAQRGGAEKANRCPRGVVEATPERQQVQRHPLGLRDVKVIRGLRHVEGREGVGQRRHRRSRRARARDGARAGRRPRPTAGKLRRTSQLYAATGPAMRASSAPPISVTGCEYTPIRIGRPNCSITVNGSWCRPTISIPNTRSDGARSTGAATTAVMIAARAETATTSATRPANVDHGGKNQERAGDGPAADVAHMRRPTGVSGHGVQRQQANRLRELERRETDERSVSSRWG